MASGCMDSVTVAAPCSSKMEPVMKAHGIWAELMDTANLLTFKARHMRVSGQMTCTMARVCRLTSTSSAMRDSLRRACRMESDQRRGLTAAPSLETTFGVNEMDTEFRNGPITSPMQVTTKTDLLRALARTLGPMDVNLLVNGKTRKFTVSAYKSIQRDADMKGSTSWISDTDMAFTRSDQTTLGIQVLGLRANNMASVLFRRLIKRVNTAFT